jgi:peptide-methionine (R)-S-oxide reductase
MGDPACRWQTLPEEPSGSPVVKVIDTAEEASMNRRIALRNLAMLAAFPLISACSRGKALDITAGPITVKPLNKPHEEWRSLVSPAAYRVLFEDDTEPPRSSALNKEDRAGTYLCAACYLALFDSADKYESGTGWPSFTQPIKGHVATRRDYSHIMPRTEYHCARCGGHQGHVFDDGPSPRGERWCNNGLALKFILKANPIPPLRS